jgi:hypothetical protein
MSTTFKRTLRARLIAYIWSHRGYLCGWFDGVIFAWFVFVIAMVLAGATP